MGTISPDTVQKLYVKVDRESSAIPKICKKGCFACCFQPIEIFTFEKPILEGFIKNQMNEEQRNSISERTVLWLDFFNKNTSNIEPLSPHEAFVNFRSKAERIPFPCPLLIDGKCSVYKARPLGCRTHSVNDDKKNCEIDKLRNSSEDSMQLRSYAIQILKNGGVSLEVVPLTYALVEILGVNRQLKKIELARM